MRSCRASYLTESSASLSLKDPALTRLVFLQHGDFAEAYHRLRAGAGETYRDQQRSVDYVAGLAGRFSVTVCCFGTNQGRQDLAPGLSVIDLPANGADDAGVARQVMGERPDLVICRGPHAATLAAVKAAKVPTLPVFADLFATGGLRQGWRNARMRRLLQGPHIACVSNHSRNAATSLVTALGLRREQVIPWDWARLPVAAAPRTAVAHPEEISIFYAGMLRQDKGVADALAAVAQLRQAGVAARITLAGGGDLEAWRARAAEHDLGQAATFLGLVPFAEVGQQMQAHDVVVVPSHHSYPEGLPNTIYEALAARAALVLSDHPAFAGRLRPEEECLTFPAGDAAALATTLRRLAETPALYAQLSDQGAAGLERLYYGIDWITLMEHYLADPQDTTGWVAPLSLAARGLG